MNSRFDFLLLLVLAWQFALGATVHPPAAGDQVLIVTSSGVPAYEEVLENLRKGISRQAVYVLDLKQKDADSILNVALRMKTIKVVVTIGSEAAETAVEQAPAAPVIAAATMPHLFPKDAVRHPLSVIPVQAPFSALLDNVKRVFPGKSRLGMIHNPTLPATGIEKMKSAAEAAGFRVRIVECAGPGQLLAALQSFKDQVDLVLCFPDASLYNSATVKPLVLASLRYRLPLIGFSESFARAGAVLGVYPDFAESGVHAADLVQKVLNGQPVSKVEHSRRWRVAVNQNICRLLGLSYTQPSGADVDFVVIR
jgi:ABC-type uncharacterized transport system substrate-binding protein